MKNTVYVKSWIVQKNLGIGTNEYAGAKEVNFEFKIEKETVKAVYGFFPTSYGRVYGWFPKSQTMTTAEKIEEDNARTNRYEEVLAFAKDNGLRVRKGMKMATLKAKIAEAGLILN